MAIIQFRATRQNVSGVASGSLFQINTSFRTVTPSQRRFGVFNQSLSGRREGILYRIDQLYQLSNSYHLAEHVPYWQMFIASVMNAEPFTIFNAVLDDPSIPEEMTVELMSTTVTQQRLGRRIYRADIQVRQRL